MRYSTGWCLVVIASLVLVATPVLGADTGTQIRHVYPADNRTTGVNPVPVGEPLVVEGVTFLDPDENVIVVNILTADYDVVATNDTEEWGRDGVWRVQLETSDLVPGRYTLEVDDGHKTLTRIIRLVQPTPTPTEAPQPTPTLTPTLPPTAPSTPSPTVTSTPTSTATSTSTPGPTEEDGDGLGVVVALAALGLAVATRFQQDR